LTQGLVTWFDEMHYDREGNEIGFYRWAVLFGNHDYCIVRQDSVGESYFISTVWMGLDHGFGYSDEPVIFESMVFKDGADVESARYATEAEALEGHERFLNQVRLIGAWSEKADQESSDDTPPRDREPHGSPDAEEV
jgi:hypothetical protein